MITSNHGFSSFPIHNPKRSSIRYKYSSQQIGGTVNFRTLPSHKETNSSQIATFFSLQLTTMNIKFFITSGVICLFFYFDSVYPHGRLMEPPGRSSLWRFEEFEEFNPPINYDDNQLFCGSKEVQHEMNGGRCGECGDAWNQTKPRDNENGGIYGNGIIVRNYTRGQNISISIELTAPHLGHFEFKICPLLSSSDVEQQSCFDQNQLQILLDSGTEFGNEIPIDNTLGEVNLTATLPADLICEHCSLLWYYETGNSWGDCGNGTEAVGCGPQEEFRGCADIAILPM